MNKIILEYSSRVLSIPIILSFGWNLNAQVKTVYEQISPTKTFNFTDQLSPSISNLNQHKAPSASELTEQKAPSTSDLTKDFKSTDKEPFKTSTYQPPKIEKINPELLNALSKEQRNLMLKEIEEYKKSGNFELLQKDMTERINQIEKSTKTKTKTKN